VVLARVLTVYIGYFKHVYDDEDDDDDDFDNLDDVCLAATLQPTHAVTPLVLSPK